MTTISWSDGVVISIIVAATLIASHLACQEERAVRVFRGVAVVLAGSAVLNGVVAVSINDETGSRWAVMSLLSAILAGVTYVSPTCWRDRKRPGPDDGRRHSERGRHRFPCNYTDPTGALSCNAESALVGFAVAL